MKMKNEYASLKNIKNVNTGICQARATTGDRKPHFVNWSDDDGAHYVFAAQPSTTHAIADRLKRIRDN